MNIKLIVRAVRRHSYMKDGAAYRQLLEHARAHGDVWMVPQRDVARWWEARQTARLRIVRTGSDAAAVSWQVDGAVVEVDGERLETAPFEVPWNQAAAADLPHYAPATVSAEFLSELVGHLGYNHVTVDAAAASPLLSGPEWEQLLGGLRTHALQHQRFEPELLAGLRQRFRDAHHRVGLPDLRLWHWPHRDGVPYRMALSVRYDVDKAIVNMPMIHRLEDGYGLRSTAYVRPMGLFYGRREIVRYARQRGGHEIALHGEFVSTSRQIFANEFAAAAGERDRLADQVGEEVSGVCMHGGELVMNLTPNSRDAVEQAGFAYETFFRNRYYLPLHVPHGGAVRRTLSIGQHFMDVSVPPTPAFADVLASRFEEHFQKAAAAGGVFVPVMHPLYHGVGNYLRHPINAWRIAVFVPKFVYQASRLRGDQLFTNK